MNAERLLIVNADDFGLSPGVNRGVIRAYEEGIVTSASLMVRWPAAADAAAYAREHRGLSLGLHLDLGEWVYRNDEWVPLYGVVPYDDVSALNDEIARQLETFARLSGMVPTHIDSHQHVHRRDPLHSVLDEIARSLAVPLRQCSPSLHYCGRFFGQTAEGTPLPDNITVDTLVKILAELPAGITELSCHPAESADFGGTYRTERLSELKTLCDPRVRSALDNMSIRLCAFHDADR